MKDTFRYYQEHIIEMGLEIELTHLRFFGKDFQDRIQQLGEALVGADTVEGQGEDHVFESSLFFRRQIIDIVVEKITKSWDLHNFRAFNKPQTLTWKIRNVRKGSTNPVDLERITARRYRRDLNVTAPSSVSWYASSALRYIKTALHVGLYHTHRVITSFMREKK